jgi:hypothetical protein
MNKVYVYVVDDNDNLVEQLFGFMGVLAVGFLLLIGLG